LSSRGLRKTLCRSRIPCGLLLVGSSMQEQIKAGCNRGLRNNPGGTQDSEKCSKIEKVAPGGRELYQNAKNILSPIRLS